MGLCKLKNGGNVLLNHPITKQERRKSFGSRQRWSWNKRGKRKRVGRATLRTGEVGGSYEGGKRGGENGET